MNSIIQRERRCLVCGDYLVQDHHIFHGTAKRKLSEKYGLKVWLCNRHHTGEAGVHSKNGHFLDLKIKKLGQQAFEYHYPDLEFIRIFGRNYLE